MLKWDSVLARYHLYVSIASLLWKSAAIGLLTTGGVAVEGFQSGEIGTACGEEGEMSVQLE